MAKKPNSKQALTPIQRAVAARDRHIARMEASIQAISRKAEEEIAMVRKKIAKTKVLRDALHRGELKP